MKSIASEPKMNEIPDFKTFDEFLEWLKSVPKQTVWELETSSKLVRYFDAKHWGWPERKRLIDYIKSIRKLFEPGEPKKADVVIWIVKNYEDKNTTESSGSEPPEDKKEDSGLPPDLQVYPKNNIKLIGVYESGATIATGKNIPDAFTCDLKVIENLWLGKDERAKEVQIRRFYFRPEDAGLLCLDIDRKNGKDGVSELYKFLKNELAVQGPLLPKILREIPQNFPFYVESPNGFHLYFKYSYNGNAIKNTLAEGVEIKTSSLTTGGSIKDDKPYIIHGRFDDIPPLPPLLKVAILQKPVTIKHKRYNRNTTSRNKPSWTQIKSWCRIDFPDLFRDVGVGYRDNQAYCMAGKAKSKGYTYDETLDALLEDEDVNDLGAKTLEEKVRSAYKRVYK